MSLRLRDTLAVILGLVLAFSTIFLIEGVGHQIYPPSAEIFDAQERLSSLPPSDKEARKRAESEMKEAMEGYLDEAPAGALWMILIAWFCGSFFGSFGASALASSRRLTIGMVIGIMVFLGAVANFIMLPVHPLWMVLTSLILILPLSYLATGLGRKLFLQKNTGS